LVYLGYQLKSISLQPPLGVIVVMPHYGNTKKENFRQ
jgi:hypothetical protein